MAVKPITPAEVVAIKASLFPDEILEAFNELIAENFTGGVASFTEKKVSLLAKLTQITGWKSKISIGKMAGR